MISADTVYAVLDTQARGSVQLRPVPAAPLPAFWTWTSQSTLVDCRALLLTIEEANDGNLWGCPEDSQR